MAALTWTVSGRRGDAGGLGDPLGPAAGEATGEERKGGLSEGSCREKAELPPPELG
eukprot:CAMPEP_0197709400 /NCGR_PEP_ID=MMETSP1338-20131121/128437_1 /TAXON_ID=43686 ORGANISM="Pelagodinium beii, Strain RCC1491" /NCGR_SAMPLE_ID=MMETSP1338 /ASSEMBLY_ACC=CAM_ASM_000754 /LENGTH=55 /DNA_ID=CAMNT_0043293333 /DNA_START=118 /DNA_END=286 /DNA_ORIENTATION=-